MRRKTAIATGVVLVASLAANAYLVQKVVAWQEAWSKQFSTTATVEHIYKNSGADVSRRAVEAVVAEHWSDYELLAGQALERVDAASYDTAIRLQETMLLFDGGEYVGSKSDLPPGLRHWRTYPLLRQLLPSKSRRIESSGSTVPQRELHTGCGHHRRAIRIARLARCAS